MTGETRNLKIHILRVPQVLQPDSQPFHFPRHNRDYGVEQDFLEYLGGQSALLSDSSANADWHYLPVYWTRWHLNHAYGTQGRDELQAMVADCIVDDAKTFTICQYSDGPLVELGRTILFLASRKGAEGIDIPLLCSPHKRPLFGAGPKKYLASFMGRLDTHPIRQEMADALSGRPDIFIQGTDAGTKLFVKTILQSFVSLCPRGHGGSSFRFFESMQLGVVPFLLSDIDTRPFKNQIDWNRCSLCTDSLSKMRSILDSIDKSEFDSMGRHAFQIWKSITFQKWCGYAIQELTRRQ